MKHQLPHGSGLNNRSISTKTLPPDPLVNSFDELNALWNEAEEEFAAMRLPTKVSVPAGKRHYPDEPGQCGPTGVETYSLGWIKCKGEWRLCWGNQDVPANDNLGEEVWKPIAECPMEKRVELAEHLAALKKMMKEAKEAYLPKVANAIAHLKKALAD